MFYYDPESAEEEEAAAERAPVYFEEAADTPDTRVGGQCLCIAIADAQLFQLVTKANPAQYMKNVRIFFSQNQLF